MDQYVSWGLSSEDLNLDTIWGKYEFCKPQKNKVCTCFDLLMSSRQESRSMYVWFNTVLAQISLAKYSPKQPGSYIVTSIGFSCLMKNLYPNQVRQLAKKMEGSKATACHIKQVVGDSQAAKINLMRHQHTEISTGKHKKRESVVKSKQQVRRLLFMRIPRHQAIARRALVLEMCTRIRIMFQVWRVNPCGRLSVPCEEIPM